MALILVAGLGAIGWAVKQRIDADQGGTKARPAAGPAPVEVQPVERGPIESRRTYSGTLEANAEFVVSPKVGGRIEKLEVDLADRVRRGQVVAKLDDAEYVQAIAQANADLAVADANIVQAESVLLIAKRELDRVQTLRTDGVASEAELDAVKADILAKEAAVTVAKAQAKRATATVETMKIRQAYTQVKATWNEEDEYRIVSDRYVDEGDTVTANARLLSIIRLHPMTGVVYATEKDYARLAIDQSVSLTTDAYVGRTFPGKIARIAPIFRQSSRQARIELAINNTSQELKPGMFIRAEIVLATESDAIIVPLDALVTRDKKVGVFIVDEATKTVMWKPVVIGIRDEDRVQVIGDGIAGRVVTLGQQLIRDGAKITIPADDVATKKNNASAKDSNKKQPAAGDKGAKR